MNTNYRTLSNLVVKHDYYRLGQKNGDSIWNPDIVIGKDLLIFPTAETRQLLRDYRLLFKLTPNGFRILAEVLPSALSPGEVKTKVLIDPGLKFTFFLAVQNPHFINFTNLRLDDFKAHLYYFSNLSSNEHNYTVLDPDGGPDINKQKLYLSKQHAAHSTAVDYRLGDLILEGGTIQEAITANVGAFQAANWENLGSPVDARYVSQLDRIALQKPTYAFKRSNSFAKTNKSLRFTLEEKVTGKAHPINYGTLVQDQFQYPTSPLEDLEGRLFLNHLPPAYYQLSITEDNTTQSVDFFLLNPLQYPSVFAVVDLVTNDSADNFQFLNYQSNETTLESIVQSKSYEIRFKNRTTVWEYYDKNGQLQGPSPGRRALTQVYSDFKFNDVLLPDPEVDMIYPSLTDDALKSKVYLNDSIKI